VANALVILSSIRSSIAANLLDISASFAARSSSASSARRRAFTFATCNEVNSDASSLAFAPIALADASLSSWAVSSSWYSLATFDLSSSSRNRNVSNRLPCTKVSCSTSGCCSERASCIAFTTALLWSRHRITPSNCETFTACALWESRSSSLRLVHSCSTIPLLSCMAVEKMASKSGVKLSDGPTFEFGLNSVIFTL